MTRHAALALATLLALAGCTEDPTEVVVHIDAEMNARGMGARLHVLVLDSDRNEALSKDAEPPAFPAHVPLFPRGDDASRSYELVAELFDASDHVIGRQRAIGSYVAHESLSIRLVFDDACRDMLCGDLETCIAGACTDACFDPTPDATARSVPHACGANEDGGTLPDARTDAPPPPDGGASDGGLVFGPAEPIAALNAGGVDANPTLPSDLLELYFNSSRGGGGDHIWVSRRMLVTDPWPSPTQVAGLPDGATEPGITADGLTLYFTMPGTVSTVWATTRASRDAGASWSAPTEETSLNDTTDNTGAAQPFDGAHGITVNSWRPVTHGLADIWIATRAGSTGAWDAPMNAGDLVNTGLIDMDPHLANDTTLFFARRMSGMTASGTGDLFVATRPTAAAPFDSVLRIDELSVAGQSEAGPWVSADLRYIVFARQTGTDWDLYEASR